MSSCFYLRAGKTNKCEVLIGVCSFVEGDKEISKRGFQYLPCKASLRVIATHRKLFSAENWIQIEFFSGLCRLLFHMLIYSASMGIILMYKVTSLTNHLWPVSAHSQNHRNFCKFWKRWKGFKRPKQRSFSRQLWIHVMTQNSGTKKKRTPCSNFESCHLNTDANAHLVLCMDGKVKSNLDELPSLSVSRKLFFCIRIS